MAQLHTRMIPGKKVNLRPATMQDRKHIFDWLTNSDLTSCMMGPPAYPDSKIPTWDEFREDYKEYFFNGSQPLLGRCFIIEVNGVSVGQINHDRINTEDLSTELDIWLRSSQYTGKGYGTDALETLCTFLNKEYSCKKFIIAPSKRNTRAVQAYKKAGFIESAETIDSPDYSDTIVLVKTL